MKRFLILFLLVLLTCCGVVYLYLKHTGGSLGDFDPIILYPFCLAASFVLATILNLILSPRMRRMTPEEIYASRPDESQSLRTDILDNEGLETRVVEAESIESAHLDLDASVQVEADAQNLEAEASYIEAPAHEGVAQDTYGQDSTGSAGVAALGAAVVGAAGLAALTSDSDEDTAVQRDPIEPAQLAKQEPTQDQVREPIEDAAITPEHITEKIATLSEQHGGIVDDPNADASSKPEYGDAGRPAKSRFSARRRYRHYAVAANRALPKVEAPKPAPVPRREIVRRALDFESRAKIASERARQRFGAQQVKVEPFRVEKKSKFFDT